MGIKKIDAELSFYEKFQYWFGRHSIKLTVFMTVVVFLSLVLSLTVISAERKREHFYQEMLDRATKFVVTTTPDGRIVTVEKVPISASVLEKYVRANIANYFLLDRNDFTLGGQGEMLIPCDTEHPVPFFKRLFKYSRRIKILSDFFDAKDKKSFQTFYLFLKYLYGMAKAGKLPDIIAPTYEIEGEEFSTKGNRFFFKGNFLVNVSYVGIDQKWHKGKGVISATVMGYFDPLKSSEINPYGMKIDGVKVKWVTTASLKKIF